MSNQYFSRALELILAQLSREFTRPDVKPTPAEDFKIPVLLSVRSEGRSKVPNGGANHGNLIQIKGRVAHSSQPVFVQPYKKASYVLRPKISTVVEADSKQPKGLDSKS